mmetsp:Transcript_5782/g.18397  ORF Transcript_5782/g.18397 Transcript_5782/m.18397 type:complete len:207 (-) Transcript_5782:722-1342(-)
MVLKATLGAALRSARRHWHKVRNGGGEDAGGQALAGSRSGSRPPWLTAVAVAVAIAIAIAATVVTAARAGAARARAARLWITRRPSLLKVLVASELYKDALTQKVAPVEVLDCIFGVAARVEDNKGEAGRAAGDPDVADHTVPFDEVLHVYAIHVTWQIPKMHARHGQGAAAARTGMKKCGTLRAPCSAPDLDSWWGDRPFLHADC